MSLKDSSKKYSKFYVFKKKNINKRLALPVSLISLKYIYYIACPR